MAPSVSVRCLFLNQLLAVVKQPEMGLILAVTFRHTCLSATFVPVCVTWLFLCGQSTHLGETKTKLVFSHCLH